MDSSIFPSDLSELFRQWFLAIAIIPVTYAAIVTVRTTGARALQRRGWFVVNRLVPSAARLLVIPGLRLFADLAPLNEKALRWIDHGTYVLTVLLILSLIRQAALLGIEWGTLRANSSRTLQQGFIPVMRNIITLFVFVTGAIMVLKHFNYDVLSLLTALGVGSLAVGLAAKDALANMISGFILIIDRNLKPGDRINLGGSVGDVDEIGLRSTRIRIGDGNLLIVPNAELVNTKILNLSLPTRELACNTTFKVPYEVPFDRVKEICTKVLNGTKGILRSKTPAIMLSSLADGAQTITISFWVSDLDESGSVTSEVNAAILRTLGESGVPIGTTMPAAPAPIPPPTSAAEPRS